MRIDLKSMKQPAEGVAVGTLDGEPFIYHARSPTAGGREYTHADVQDALRDAVDECCQKLWGSEWSGPLSVATGLNRRACSKDRVWKFGLPAWTLRFLGEAAGQPFPRAVGDLLCGIARVYDADEYKSGTAYPQTFLTQDELMDAVQGRLLTAVDLLATMRTARRRAQTRGTDTET